MISVVIPVFNGEQVIAKALISLVKQSNKNFDVIIVDDGSNDATCEKIKRFSLENKQLKIMLISTPNRGRSVARNIGLINSANEFVCFLDADDEFNINHIEDISNAIVKFPECNFFFGDSEIVRLDDSWTKHDGFMQRLLNRGDFWIKDGDYILFNEDFAFHLIEGSLIPMCSTAIRRKTAVEAGLFNLNYSVSEDFEFWFRLALENVFIGINKKLSTVNHHYDNTSHPSKRFSTIQQQIRVTEHILKNYKDLSPLMHTKFIEKRESLFSNLLYQASLISSEKVFHILLKASSKKLWFNFRWLKLLASRFINKLKSY